MGEGPSGTADHVDTPRTRAYFARSSVHQTWQALHITGFCALTAALVVDGSLNGACLPLVKETLYAGDESLAHGDRCFRHHAVALCLHRFGDQTILFRIPGGIFGAGKREAAHLAAASPVLHDMRACDFHEIHRNCYGPTNCLPRLRTVSSRLAFALEAGIDSDPDHHRPLGARCCRLELLLGSPRRRCESTAGVDYEFSIPVFRERDRYFWLTHEGGFHLRSGAVVQYLCRSARFAYPSGNGNFWFACDGMYRGLPLRTNRYSG